MPRPSQPVHRDYGEGVKNISEKKHLSARATEQEREKKTFLYLPLERGTKKEQKTKVLWHGSGIKRQANSLEWKFGAENKSASHKSKFGVAQSLQTKMATDDSGSKGHTVRVSSSIMSMFPSAAT